MLQKKTVEKETLDLLNRLMKDEVLSSTRLVGGTSLALQIGHRKSTDLDLFTTEQPDIEHIVEHLKKEYGYSANLITKYTTIGYISGIKIDVIYHPFHWLKPPVIDGDVRLASTEDIAAMKMHAITNSGTRPKDFVDIAYLSTRFSYNAIKDMAIDKYPSYDPVMFDRAILYFDDVNQDAIGQIKMTADKLDFGKIKRRLVHMTDRPDHVFATKPL